MRIGPQGHERPAILDAGGQIRDLSGIIKDVGGADLLPESLARLAGLDLETLPLTAPGERIGSCISQPGKFICVGLNYADHAAESGMAAPEEPVLFMKAPSAICGPYDNVIIPRGATKMDWEVELGVVIGRTARYVDKADAFAHIAGYCIVNDVSERAFQLERGGQWLKGKSADTFAPTGPWLVTSDEIADPQSLSMWLEVDGYRHQSGSTRSMIFDVAHVVHYVSQFMALYPGDIISTGTPPGVAMGMKPEPKWLAPGNIMRLSIEGLGEQCQTVVDYRANCA